MPLFIPLLFVMLLSILGAAKVPELQEQSSRARSGHLVTSLFAYRQGLNAHLYARPGLSGEINTGLVTMPEGFVDNGLWRNYVENGVVFVYSNPDRDLPQNTILQAFQSAHRTPLLGINVNGKLMGATGFDTGLAVPPIIPNGSFVIAGN